MTDWLSAAIRLLRDIREKTFLAAVKTAVFDDKQHRDEAAKVLHQLSRKKILILGTSDKMVNKIAMRLQIQPPQKIIRIEDIATREEIETAIRSRRVEGKHVIPVPSVEVKRNYPQIFYDKIRLLFRNTSAGPLKEEETLFVFQSVFGAGVRGGLTRNGYSTGNSVRQCDRR